MPSPSPGRIGPHVGDRAVAQDDVGLPLDGVAGWERLVLAWPHRATPPVAPSRLRRRRTAPRPPGTLGRVELREAVLHRRMVRRFDPAAGGAARGRARPASHWPCAPPAPGSARAGTSWSCSTRPTGRRSGPPPTTAPRPTPGAAASQPPPRSCSACRDPGAYLDRYAEPDKGWTDRSTDHWPVPYWDTDVGHGGDGHAARRRRTPAWARCSSGCPSSGTTRSARRSASPRAAASSASSRSATRPSGSSGSPRTRRRRPLDEVLARRPVRGHGVS